MVILVNIKISTSQFQLDRINNTVSIFYNEESYLKVSNNKWTLLVYKDLQPIKDALDHNEKTLYALSEMLHENNPRINSFKPQLQTHFSLLQQISDQVNIKFRK